MRRLIGYAAALLSATLAAGCASDKRYAALPEQNLVIRADIQSGVRAVLGVHAVDAKCELAYEGSVPLEQPVVRVGIPSGRPSLLLFRFATSSFLGSRQGAVDRETLLRPRPGATYDIRVTYKNDLYDVVIRESVSPGGQGRDVPLAALRACAASA